MSHGTTLSWAEAEEIDRLPKLPEGWAAIARWS
jgi:hypothetical protein